MAISPEELKRAADLAMQGEWDEAHALVQQDETDPVSCWLHACLHKIEGDESNARYWYRRSGGHVFEDFTDPAGELRAIGTLIKSGLDKA